MHINYEKAGVKKRPKCSVLIGQSRFACLQTSKSAFRIKASAGKTQAKCI